MDKTKKILLFSPTGRVGIQMYSLLQENNFQIRTITRNTTNIRKNENIDMCIYSAGITSTRKEMAEKYIIDNCSAAVNLVHICQQHNVKKVIYISSDEVYGDIYTEYLDADSDKVNPNIYAMSKLLSEQVIKESGISYDILRLPGIVGGGGIGKSFLERVAVKMNKNEDVDCYHTGKKFNNVVHINDLCNFILSLVKREDTNDCHILHLGQTEPELLINLLNYIKKSLNSTSNIVSRYNKKRYFVLPTYEAETLGYNSRGIYSIMDEIVMVIKNHTFI